MSFCKTSLVFTSRDLGPVFSILIYFEQPLSRHLLKILRNGRDSFEAWGEKILIRRVRVSVLPTWENHSVLKSLYYPLKIGKNPNQRSYPGSRKLRLITKMMTPILMNYKMVSFWNIPIVSSLLVWFLSMTTILLMTVPAITLITITTKEVTITMAFWRTKLLSQSLQYSVGSSIFWSSLHVELSAGHILNSLKLFDLTPVPSEMKFFWQ